MFTILQAAVLLAYSAAAYPDPDESPSPRFIFEPIKTQVAQCSQLGTEWRSRLATALRSAQSYTANLFPAESWANLQPTSTKLDDNSPTNLQVDTCKKFVAYLSDPLLSNHVRSNMIIGIYIQGVTGCAAEFPSLANGLRAAWIGAFKRNGFDTNEQLFDEYHRSNWRKPSADQNQKNECKKMIVFLKGTDFDKAASEQGVKLFFEHF